MFTVLIYSSEKPAVLEMHSWHVQINLTIFKYFLNDNDVTKQIKVPCSVMNEIKFYRPLLWDIYSESWFNNAVISNLSEQTPSWVCRLCDFCQGTVVAPFRIPRYSRYVEVQHLQTPAVSRECHPGGNLEGLATCRENLEVSGDSEDQCHGVRKGQLTHPLLHVLRRQPCRRAPSSVAAISHKQFLSGCHVASTSEEFNFSCCLNSHMWLLAIMLDMQKQRKKPPLADLWVLVFSSSLWKAGP